MSRSKKNKNLSRFNEQRIAAVRQSLLQAAEGAREIQAVELLELCATLFDLTMLIGTPEGESGQEVDWSTQIIEFCEATLPLLDQARNGQDDVLQSIQETRQKINECWGEYLEFLCDEEKFSLNETQNWPGLDGPLWSEEVEFAAEPGANESYDSVDLGAVISTLDQMGHVLDSEQIHSQIKQRPAAGGASPVKFSAADLLEDSIDDPELISAYVDDAQQCLAGMEMCLLELENNQYAVESLRQFCRELHTLKGASGTVGLMKLADYLHHLETDVEEMSKGGKIVQIDPLLEGVDFVRQQVTKLLPESAEFSDQPVAATHESSPRTEPVPSEPFVSKAASATEGNGETYVRLEASRLDRLMDLLAELVMLRNRRETYVSSLQNLHHEVSGCASRLRLIDTYSQFSEVNFPDGEHPSQVQRPVQYRMRGKELTATITELSKDLGELGRSLQEVVDPLARDNSSISHLIGSFRTELMELRRQPVAGLFRRLHRVARDASKSEQRAVALNFLGQGTRAERSFQERLYEPLMHMIRNSVSHGIEPSEERLELGKPAVGQITLEAWSDATSLYLEVRDDGRGLNPERLERRGRELGLIRPGVHPTREQLWELILEPGFSTKTEVSQISGRGVGMDVVASQIRSMRGKVSIDSVIGEYTAFRLEIPLTSTIEHAMVVRCGGQLFALPMHAIYGTQTEDQIPSKQHVIGLDQLLGMPTSTKSHPKVITLRHQEQAGSRREPDRQVRKHLSISVDEVVGVEEVVVRTLPNLLRNHECFSGVTLSGEAETVLFLDVPRLSDFALRLQLGGTNLQTRSDEKPRKQDAQQRDNGQRGLNSQSPQILIVDDSISVRRSLSRKLNSHGFKIVEAADGAHALELARGGQFSAIISDLDMPRMNGIEFISELRHLEQFALIPIVVVTSRRDESATKAVAGLDVRQIFNKPVTDTMVKSMVQAIRFGGASVEHSLN